MFIVMTYSYYERFSVMYVLLSIHRGLIFQAVHSFKETVFEYAFLIFIFSMLFSLNEKLIN